MRFSGIAIAGFLLAFVFATPPKPAFAQLDEPSEELRITADSAATWERPGESVVALDGPVTIELDNATMTARRAVVWLTPDGEDGKRQRAEIALIGDAKVTQKDAKRSGDRLFVTALISGRIRFTAESRVEEDRSATELYWTADKLRRGAAGAEPVEPPPAAREAPEAPARVPDQRDVEPAPIEPGREAQLRDRTPPPRRGREELEQLPPPKSESTAPASEKPAAPVIFRGTMETVDTDDGTLAVALTDGVTLFQRRPTSDPHLFDTIELQADRAVLFTTIKDPEKDIKELQGQGTEAISKAIVAAYLEGDVRIVYTPAVQTLMGEQRLEAKRVYYEFATDRAIMTDAVVHTIQPQLNIPVLMRAKIIRQLSAGEYRANEATLSTSRFANPSYSINAQRIYMRREDTGDPRIGGRTTFSAAHPTFRFFNFPVFYLPYATGSMTDRGSILRGIGFENSTAFGTGVETKWGLFETLGQPRPNEVDATYRVDYFSDRGFAGGLDFEYGGGIISDTLREHTNFEGKLESYGVRDSGFDDFGRGRVGEVGNDLDGETRNRGHVLYEHQHFFFNDYQLQLRAGYVSDATFLEQWFERDFDEGPPHDVSLYVKRQQDTEAYTFLTQIQPSNVVTISDLLQEQLEVERIPELGYRRIGDSFFDDRLTFYSRNTLGGYRFNTTRATLGEQGFFLPGRPPGIPSLGFGDIDQDTTLRGDFRQEVTLPIAAGAFKVVPYVVGRYTGYSDSPDESNVNRLYGAVGARISTSFWKLYNGVESRLLDIHRVRHVIEPELNLFAAAATDDRNDVFVYEEDVDGIHDLSAVQIALRQRWQTKRGGAGRWRSVDFFTLNVEGNFFANQPDDAELNPVGFRGLYFASMPEASIPRNSANADATWRISDNTVVLADVQQNLDEHRLATAGVGLLVRRDERLTYFIGNRYIDELSSNITSVAVSYELSPKYMITFSQAYDFAITQHVSSSIGLLRNFDAFFVQVAVAHDSTSDQTAFNFNIFPKGLGYGVNAEQLGSVFRNDRE